VLDVVDVLQADSQRYKKLNPPSSPS
jgi:hypothetical protein